MTQDAPACKAGHSHAAAADSHVVLASAVTATTTNTAAAAAAPHLFKLSEHSLGWG